MAWGIWAHGSTLSGTEAYRFLSFNLLQPLPLPLLLLSWATQWNSSNLLATSNAVKLPPSPAAILAVSSLSMTLPILLTTTIRTRARRKKRSERTYQGISCCNTGHSIRGSLPAGGSSKPNGLLSQSGKGAVMLCK